MQHAAIYFTRTAPGKPGAADFEGPGRVRGELLGTFLASFGAKSSLLKKLASKRGQDELTCGQDGPPTSGKFTEVAETYLKMISFDLHFLLFDIFDIQKAPNSKHWKNKAPAG